MCFWRVTLTVKYIYSFPLEEIYILNSQHVFSRYSQHLVLSHFSAEMRFCIILHSVFPLLNLTNLSLSVLIVVQTAFSYILAMQWLSVYSVASIRSNHYTNLRNRKGFRIFIELLFLAKLIFWRNYTLCNKSTASDI